MDKFEPSEMTRTNKKTGSTYTVTFDYLAKPKTLDTIYDNLLGLGRRTFTCRDLIKWLNGTNRTERACVGMRIQLLIDRGYLIIESRNPTKAPFYGSYNYALSEKAQKILDTYGSFSDPNAPPMRWVTSKPKYRPQ